MFFFGLELIVNGIYFGENGMRYIGRLVSIFFCIALFIFICTPMEGYTKNPMALHSTVIQAQTTHEPIIINGDADLESYGWPGEGTSDNPYIISGLHIESANDGISVYNTLLFFKIVDCEIVSNNSDSISSGIHFDRVKNGAVEACFVEGFGAGVDIYLSSDCSISSVEIVSSKEDALTIHNSNTVKIENCTISDSGFGAIVAYQSSLISLSYLDLNEARSDGIRIDTCDSVSILQSQIESTLYCGISFYNSQNLAVSDCTIQSTSMDAIEFDLCRNMTLLRCEVTDCMSGFESIHSMNLHASNNSISHTNGVAIHIYQTPKTNLSGNTVNDCGEGIILSTGSDDSSISSNSVSNVMVDGIFLSYCDNVVIANNIVIESAEDGLEAQRCSNVSLIENECHWIESWAGVDGIRIDSCERVDVERNLIENARDIGLHVYGDSSFTTILFNRIQDSRNDGVLLLGLSNATVVGNIFDSSFGNGVSIEYSNDIVFSWNRLNGSGEYNLYLASPQHFRAYLNEFIDSGIAHTYTRINTNASWHNGTHGNYWDDYIGHDIDGDGIGDIPYDIGRNMEDPFPLMTGNQIDDFIKRGHLWSAEPATNETSESDTSLEEAVELILIVSPTVQIVAIVILIYELKRRGVIFD